MAGHVVRLLQEIDIDGDHVDAGIAGQRLFQHVLEQGAVAQPSERISGGHPKQRIALGIGGIGIAAQLAEAIGNGQRQQQRSPADGGKAGQIDQIILRQQAEVAEDAQHQHGQRRQPTSQIIPDRPAAAQRRKARANRERKRDDDQRDVEQKIAQRCWKQRVERRHH